MKVVNYNYYGRSSSAVTGCSSSTSRNGRFCSKCRRSTKNSTSFTSPTTTTSNATVTKNITNSPSRGASLLSSLRTLSFPFPSHCSSSYSNSFPFSRSSFSSFHSGSTTTSTTKTSALTSSVSYFPFRFFSKLTSSLYSPISAVSASSSFCISSKARATAATSTVGAAYCSIGDVFSSSFAAMSSASLPHYSSSLSFGNLIAV